MESGQLELKSTRAYRAVKKTGASDTDRDADHGSDTELRGIQ